jgi:hypothetical protein
MATVSGSQSATAKGQTGAAGAGKAQAAPFNINTFLHRTTPQVTTLQPNQAWTDGGTQYWNLPQAGLASILMVNLDMEVVVGGTVTSGTFNKLPAMAPWSILKQITLASNQNLNLHSYSGTALYQWLRLRYGTDPFLSANTGFFQSSATAASLGFGNATNPVVPGANIAAGTYSCRLSFPIPIAYNRECMTGLLFLQNNSVVYQLGIQWGNVINGISATGGSNDLFNTLVGTGLSVTATVSSTVEIETLLIPRSYPPDTSMFMSINETTFPLNAGFNSFRPPVNDIYTWLGCQVINNGAAITSDLITSNVFVYSSNLRRNQESALNKAVWTYWTKGVLPPDGFFEYDFGMRKGLKEKRDVFDSFNYTKVTDLQIQFNIPSTTSITGANQIRFISEALRYISQH